MDGGASGGGTGGAVENEIGALKQSKHPEISFILQCTDLAFFYLADYVSRKPGTELRASSWSRRCWSGACRSLF